MTKTAQGHQSNSRAEEAYVSSRESSRNVHFLSMVAANAPPPIRGECHLFGYSARCIELSRGNNKLVVSRQKVSGPCSRPHARVHTPAQACAPHPPTPSRWKSVPWPRTRSRYPRLRLGRGRPQSWLGSQAKMILLLACLSLLIGPGELGTLSDGPSVGVTAVLGLSALPFGFAAGPRYRRQSIIKVAVSACFSGLRDAVDSFRMKYLTWGVTLPLAGLEIGFMIFFSYKETSYLRIKIYTLLCRN